MKTIILGIGNQILGDDGVGVHVSNELKKYVKDPNIVIEEAVTGGMNLLELILDFDKAIIIDAVKTETGKNGEVKKIPLSDFSTLHSCNPHDISLFEAINMAKKMGETKIPKEIIIIGILMKKIPCEFSEGLSPEIFDAVPNAITLVLNEIKKDYKILNLGVKK
jgi:hydrogenase maturation protease